VVFFYTSIINHLHSLKAMVRPVKLSVVVIAERIALFAIIIE